MNTDIAPTKDRFEDRLLGAILDDFASLTAGSSPVAQDRRARYEVRAARGNGRPARLVVVVTGAAALAAGVLALSGVTRGSNRSPQRAAPTATAHSGGTVPRIETVAYVRARVESALTAATTDDDIVYEQKQPVGAGGDWVDAWADPVTGNARYDLYSAGTLFSEEQSVRALEASGVYQWTNTTVYPTSRTWSTTTVSASSPPGEGTAVPTDVNPASIASELHRALDDDQITKAGTGTLEGVSAVELGLAASADGETEDLWVDASSYQPLQFDLTGADGTGTTINLEFRARTPANLAQLTVQVPAGYNETAIRASNEQQ